LKSRGTVKNDMEWELAEDVAEWESTF